jgi:hypothetical protein
LPTKKRSWMFAKEGGQLALCNGALLEDLITLIEIA